MNAEVRVITRDGQPRGFGYADFENEDDYNKALEMNGMEFSGREMRINPADSKPNTPKSGGRDGGGRGRGRGRGGRGGRGGGRGGGFNSPQNPPNSSLIVRNLSYDTTTESLGAAFEGCSSARVITDRDSGQSRG